MNETFPFEAVTLQDLAEIAKPLQDASPGYDDLPMYIYKNNSDVLGGTLLSISNKSMQQAMFPYVLKIAKITPNFKSGGLIFL